MGGRGLQGAVELILNFPQQQSWPQQLTTSPDVLPPPSPPPIGSVNTSCRLPGGASGSLSLRSLLANQRRRIQTGWKGFRRGGKGVEEGPIRRIRVCASCHMMLNDNQTSEFSHQSGQR